SSSSVSSFPVAATPAVCTLSLHDALPISRDGWWRPVGHTTAALPGPAEYAKHQGRMQSSGQKRGHQRRDAGRGRGHVRQHLLERSEEHTSELQSRENLVCRLLLEKKKHTH